jgi:hypothetical protein
LPATPKNVTLIQLGAEHGKAPRYLYTLRHIGRVCEEPFAAA